MTAVISSGHVTSCTTDRKRKSSLAETIHSVQTAIHETASCTPTVSSSLFPSENSMIRRLSDIASTLSVPSVVNASKTKTELTEDNIRKTGGRLLKAYVRDRLHRLGFLPSDETWNVLEEENNNTNSNTSRRSNQTGNVVTKSRGQFRISKRYSSQDGSTRHVQKNIVTYGRTHSIGVGTKIHKEKSLASTECPSPSPPDLVSLQLRKYCLYLERKYASLYREASRPLNITMSSQGIVKEAYIHIAEHVISSGDNERWGKIASLFVLAGTFCADCVVQGHSDYIGDVINTSINAIFQPEVTAWIKSRGGWLDLVESSKEVKKTQDPFQVLVVFIFGLGFGFLVTMVSSFHF